MDACHGDMKRPWWSKSVRTVLIMVINTEKPCCDEKEISDHDFSLMQSNRGYHSDKENFALRKSD